MAWKFALRHLIRHWRLNLVLFTVMLLGATFLASLPMLAISIAGDSLTQSLIDAPVPVRNAVIQGRSHDEELPEEVAPALGNLLEEYINVREGQVLAPPVIFFPDGSERNMHPQTLILHLRSFDRLEERVRVLEGRLPETDGELVFDENDVEIIDTAVGLEAAARMNLSIGDEFRPADGSYRLQIVGIIEPLEPNADIWWGDRQLLPFSAWRRIYTSPDIDEWNLSLLVAPRTMVSNIRHFQHWRLILADERVTVLSAPVVADLLIGLQTELSGKNMLLRTDLIEVIRVFEQDLSLAQVSLLLLTVQAMIAVFYVLGMFGNFLVGQSQREVSTLAGRGFSRLQVTGLFARSMFLLAVVAGTAAPFVARAALITWSGWQNTPIPPFIPQDSWLLAAGTVLFGWIFLVFSIYRSTRQGVLTGQGNILRTEEGKLGSWHPIWDLLLLTIGGLAYWQFTQGGVIARRAESLGVEATSAFSDPILLLGPSLLLIAAGLLIIRLLPLLWRFFAWLSSKTRGLIWPWGFSRLARQSFAPSQVTLLISLTAGLTFFATIYDFSIDTWQEEMARYEVGADLRLSQPISPNMVQPALDQLPGLQGATYLMRSDSLFKVNEYLRLEFDLIAVDPDSFPQVVTYPTGISSFSMDTIVGTLQPISDNALPIVISSSPNTQHLGLGDRITMEIGPQTFDFQITGIIIHFPQGGQPFGVTNRALLEQVVDPALLALTANATEEIWLSVEPDSQADAVEALSAQGFGDLLVGDTESQLELFNNDLVFREVTTAFELNALVLILLSGAGYFLILIFTAQRRVEEFSILQSLGLSNRQIRSLLLVEGIIFITLGLALGVGTGIGLAGLMKPFLSQILPPLSDGFVLNQVRVDWTGIGLRLAFLTVFYGLGLVALMALSARNFIRKVDL